MGSEIDWRGHDLQTVLIVLMNDYGLDHVSAGKSIDGKTIHTSVHKDDEDEE